MLAHVVSMTMLLQMCGALAKQASKWRNLDRIQAPRWPCNRRCASPVRYLWNLFNEFHAQVATAGRGERLSQADERRIADQPRGAAIIAHTRAGVSGRSRGAAPSGLSAAATALAITPPTGMMPPSPAPLAPSGLCGAGFSSVATTWMTGKSLA